nr:hypothetical protein [Tanacetum cinerariifolium]
MGLLLIKAFKSSINSDRWGISTSIRRSRTGTELLANLCANQGKQCLQGVLNGRRKVSVGQVLEPTVLKPGSDTIIVTPLFVKKTLCHNHGVSSKHS